MSALRRTSFIAVFSILLMLTGMLTASSTDEEKEKVQSPPAKCQEPEGAIDIGVTARKKGLKLVSMVKPVYPPEAKAQGIQGSVMIDVWIDKDGVVKDAQAVSGPEALRQSALEAIRQWRYAPVRSTVKVTIDVNYVLPSEEKSKEEKPKS
jgi:TonB family protein